MDPKELEREIERRRKRALKLGVDRLVTRIYFEHGFRNYSLMHASAMAAIFPIAKSVVERERDRLDFKIEERPYAIRARERAYNGREGMEVEVFRGEAIVFGMILRRKRGGVYRTQRVTGFVEGTWLRDFERLDREAADYYYRRKHGELSKTVQERAKRFGINPANVGRDESLLRRLFRVFGI